MLSFKHEKYLLFVISLLWQTSALFAAQKYIPIKEDALLESWRWQHYGNLSGKGLRTFTQDSHKNMWFGVDNGIIFYDGFEWKNYTEENGIYGSPVQAVYATKNAFVYAGTPKGLSVFDGSQWQRVFPADENDNFDVHAIKELNNHSIAVGTNRGLLIIKNEDFTFYATKTTIDAIKGKYPEISFCQVPDEAAFNAVLDIYDLFQDNNDQLWITIGKSEDHQGKILRFSLRDNSGENLTAYTLLSDKTGHRFGSRMHMLQTNENIVWIISADHNIGVYQYDGHRWKYFLLSEILGGDDLHTNISTTTDGAVWIGGLGKLYVFKDKTWKTYKAPDVSIPPSRIIVRQMTEGNLWIAGLQNEIYSVDYAGTTWETFRNLNFQCEDKNGDQWFVSVDDKVVCRSNANWIAYDQRDGLMEHPVTLIATSKGQVWATGSQKGVASTAYFENGRWQRQIHPELSWGIDYRAVFEATDGSLWFGTGVDIDQSKGQMAGVLRLKNPLDKNKQWIHYTSEDGIQQKNAYGIAESPDGKIWIGGTALLGFDGTKWFKQQEPAQLSERVDNVHSKPGGKLWVGSRFYGIFSYDGTTWNQYTVKDGLLSNTIISINCESEDKVWVATDKDICRFDGHNWTTNIFPSQLTFTREGGSLHMSSDALWINKSLREWKRRALSSVTLPKEVLTNFYTVRYTAEKQPPDTYITFYVEEVDNAGNIVIEWTGHDAWENTKKAEITYSYRLNNDEWSPYTLDTHIPFKNLASGDYSFEVKARDKDFNIDPTPAKVSFVVLPPVYFRAWFLILMGVMLTTITYLTVKLINRNIRLRKTNSQLKEAKKETDDILHNVDEGLFLLNSEYTIGSQYSTILRTIFNTKELAQINLLELLKDKITAEELGMVEDFLEIIFQQNVDDVSLDELNPLSEIKLNFNGNTEAKYVSFKFRGVASDANQHKELIVTVRDVTAQVQLEQKLIESEKESKRQMDWLLSILHVEPKMLQDFISIAQEEVDTVAKILNSYDKSREKNYNKILLQVYRSMHLLKGNASLLALNFFADQVHEFENIISDLQNGESEKTTDLSILRSELEKIKITLDEVNKLLDKIGNIHAQMKASGQEEDKLLIRSLENLVSSTVKECGKKVKLNLDGFDGKNMPKQYKLIIKEILVQLLRNSIAHGIEDPNERKRLKKPEYGTIEISGTFNNGDYCLSVKDDGRGLALDSLKESVRKTKRFNDDEIEKWDKQQLANSVFLSGVSTSENTSMLAGRGVGLNAIKEKIEKNKGEIKLDFEEGKFCRFDVLFHMN